MSDSGDERGPDGGDDDVGLSAEPGRPILVTGASGFVGGYLVPELIARGHSVRAMVRLRERGRLIARAGAELVVADLTDADSLRRAVDGCGAVLHLAAVADSSDEVLNHDINVLGTRRLAGACVDAGVRRIVNVSSTCAGRRLQDAYGRTKQEAEAELGHSSLQVTHLRPTMIYGHGSAEFDLFAGVVARSPRVPIPGRGRTQLQPVHVEDALELMIRVLEADATVGRTYDVAGPEPVTVNAFIELLGGAQGKRRKALHVPARVALLGARVLGRVQKHPFINVDQVMAFLQDTEVDIAPARRDLAWDPRPLEVGLAGLFGGA